jgi:hypothetical protein
MKTHEMAKVELRHFAYRKSQLIKSLLSYRSGKTHSGRPPAFIGQIMSRIRQVIIW